jgi:hypothetical protein
MFRPKNDHYSVAVASFLPGRAKDLLAPLCNISLEYNYEALHYTNFAILPAT